jgi:hypothetical protein
LVFRQQKLILRRRQPRLKKSHLPGQLQILLLELSQHFRASSSMTTGDQLQDFATLFEALGTGVNGTRILVTESRTKKQ